MHGQPRFLLIQTSRFDAVLTYSRYSHTPPHNYPDDPLSRMEVCLHARTRPEHRRSLHRCKRAKRTRFLGTLTASHPLSGPSFTDCLFIMPFFCITFIRLINVLHMVSYFGTGVWDAFVLCPAILVTPGTYSFAATFPAVTGCTVALGYPDHDPAPLLSVLSRSPQLFPRALNLAALPIKN